jgi:hypothetical protein
VKARVERAQGCSGGVDAALGGAVEVDAAGEKTLASLGKGLARIVAKNAGGQLDHA